MATFGQLLYKIGRVHCNNWNTIKEVYRLTKSEYIQIVKGSGFPRYEARKTINEKWASFHDYYGLVQASGESEEDGPWILINSEKALRIIDESIPPRARGSAVAKESYYKTGRF